MNGVPSAAGQGLRGQRPLTRAIAAYPGQKKLALPGSNSVHFLSLKVISARDHVLTQYLLNHRTTTPPYNNSRRVSRVSASDYYVVLALAMCGHATAKLGRKRAHWTFAFHLPVKTLRVLRGVEAPAVQLLVGRRQHIRVPRQPKIQQQRQLHLLFFVAVVDLHGSRLASTLRVVKPVVLLVADQPLDELGNVELCWIRYGHQQRSIPADLARHWLVEALDFSESAICGIRHQTQLRQPTPDCFEEKRPTRVRPPAVEEVARQIQAPVNVVAEATAEEVEEVYVPRDAHVRSFHFFHLLPQLHLHCTGLDVRVHGLCRQVRDQLQLPELPLQLGHVTKIGG